MAAASLVKRLIRWQVCAMLTTWSLLLLWLVYQMASVDNGDLDRRLGFFATMLASTAADAGADSAVVRERVGRASDQFVSGVIETLDGVSKYVPAYQVIDSNAKVVLHSGDAPPAPLNVPQGLSDATIGGQHYRMMGATSRDGKYTIVAMESNGMRRATLLPILSIVAGSELVTLCISMAALLWAARRSFRPVQLLAMEVAARAPGDLTPVGSYASYSELAPLINAFNALLDRETVRLDTERGFLADAAHELRTPLAVLSAQAHHLISTGDPAAQAVASEQLQQGVQRLSHVLRQLLTTARLDASPFVTQLELIDAAELLRERAAALIPVAKKRDVRVEVDAPDQLMVRMNAFGLSSIVDNLVDNAIRYTPADGDVLVTLRATDETLELIVEDSGAGIPLELQEKVFERFFRVPGTLAEGSGLGLSIVKQIVLAHEGRISLHEGLGRCGLGVRIALPFEQATIHRTATIMAL